MASTDGIIYVAAGTYEASEPIDTNVSQTRTYHVHTGKLVSIQGGHLPSCGKPRRRDLYPTIVSRDLDGDDPMDATDLNAEAMTAGSAPTAMDLVAWFGFDTIEELSTFVEELPDGLREALILGALEMMSGGGA